MFSAADPTFEVFKGPDCFHMSHLVFPKEMKEFTHNLSSSIVFIWVGDRPRQDSPDHGIQWLERQQVYLTSSCQTMRSAPAAAYKCGST